MKKRIASILLAVMMIVTLLPLGLMETAWAATVVGSGDCGKNGDNVTWKLTSEGTLTISGTGDMADFDYWNGNGAPWLRVRLQAKKVIIQDGVTSIGSYAFYDCDALANVIISNGLTNIGNYAFYRCTRLANVTIPASVTAIGWGAFQGCRSLKSVKIPSGVSSIDSYTFTDCTSLINVTIPTSVTSIGKCAFMGCTGLTDIKLPTLLEVIDWRVFYGCTKLTNISIPKSVTYINEGAFYSCGSMTDVYYAGTTADWEKITIMILNTNLTSATLHCAPTAPVVHIGNSATSGKPMLTWNAVYGATSYRIYRSTSRGSGYSLLGTTTASSYTNTGAKAGTTYYYRVKAVNDAGLSPYSNIVSGQVKSVTPKPSAPVVKIGHSATSGKPMLTWNAVSGATSYKVYRATAKNGAYSVINTTKALTYTNVGAALGTTYYYKVEALNASGKSMGFSAVVEGKVAPVLAVGYSSVSGKPQLTWKAVPGATEYQVYRSTQQNSGYTKINTTTSTSYVNTGAKAGTTYYYRIVAVKGTAVSDFSNIVSARPGK